MSYKHFPAPVRVKRFMSESVIIASVWDAAEYLRRWPGKRGREYRIARQYCLDALDGLRSPGSARKAFIAAARIEGLLAPT